MSKITEGTKESRKKISELRPPADITSNTKARRAWLAEQLAIVQATPERDGKIVGIGSYQVVSVYEVKMVAGRVRFRGICQCCGHSQVVDNDMPAKSFPVMGALVMHGYNRPGDGYLIGKCPGVRMAPLNRDKQFTTAWSIQADAELARQQQRVIDATAAERAAAHAKYGNGHREEGAYQAAPREPNVGRQKNWTEREKQMVAEYRAARKVWAAAWPLSAALDAAKEELSNANTAEWQAAQTAKHFRTLLSQGTFGTELEKEVVT